MSRRQKGVKVATVSRLGEYHVPTPGRDRGPAALEEERSGRVPECRSATNIRLLRRLLQRSGKWQVPVDLRHSLRLVTARFLRSSESRDSFPAILFFVLKFFETKLGGSSIGKLMSLAVHTIRIKRQMNENTLYAGDIGM